MINKIFILALSSLLFAFGSASEAGKSFEIKGKVVDDTGSPLIGASISVKGTTNGTVGDVDGKFKLMVSDSCIVLVVSYTGYTTTEKPACAGNEIQVTLGASYALSESVVTSSGRKNSPIKNSWYKFKGKA